MIADRSQRRIHRRVLLNVEQMIITSLERPSHLIWRFDERIELKKTLLENLYGYRNDCL
jgi:hypothetical protein